MTTEEIAQFPNETKRLNETDSLVQKVDALAVKLMEEDNDLQFNIDIARGSDKMDAFVKGFMNEIIKPSEKSVVASIIQVSEHSLSFKMSPKYQMIVVDAIIKAIRTEQVDIEGMIIQARTA